MPTIKRKDDVQGMASPHGEIVYELLGHTESPDRKHSLAHIELLPGKASRKHYHPVAEESYYILSGLGRIEVDGESAHLTPGQCVMIAPESVHQIFNDGPDTLHFLAVCVPAWTPDNSVYLD